MLKRSCTDLSLEALSMRLDKGTLINSLSRTTPLSASRQTLSRIHHLKFQSPIQWNGMQKFPSLMRPGSMIKARLAPVKMNKLLPLFRRLESLQTHHNHHPKKKKKQKRGGLTQHCSPWNHLNRRVENVDPISIIPMTAKTFYTIPDQEAWKRLSRRTCVLLKPFITRTTVWWSNFRNMIAICRKKDKKDKAYGFTDEVGWGQAVWSHIDIVILSRLQDALWFKLNFCKSGHMAVPTF